MGALKRLQLLVTLIGLASFPSAQGQEASAPTTVAQAYLYLEPFHARVEVLFDVGTVAGWLQEPIDPQGALDASQRAVLKERAASFGSDWFQLIADDVTAQGGLTGTALVKGKPGATLPFKETESPPVRDLMLGFMYEFSIPGSPKRLGLRWKGGASGIHRIPLTIFFGNSTEQREFTSMMPAITWTNDDRLPLPKPLAPLPMLPEARVYSIPLVMILWIVFGLAVFVWMMVKGRKFPGGITPFIAAWVLGIAITFGMTLRIRDPFAKPAEAIASPAAAETILQPLIRNVYRAFDYRNESDIYDLLARSIDGELLRTLYLQIISGLSLDESEGARVRVKEVSVTIESVKTEGEGFSAQGQWTALGTVGHWGHQHQRINRYKAILTVNPVQGAWKLTGLTVQEERRL